MGHLGSFGAAVKEHVGDRDSFEFFGDRFEVVGTMPPILMFQLGAATTGKVDEMEGFAACWEALRTALGDDGFTRFYRLGVEKRAELDSVMQVVMALFEAQAGRPTGEPRGSSDGASTTPPSSSADASQTQGGGPWPAAFRSLESLAAG